MEQSTISQILKSKLFLITVGVLIILTALIIVAFIALTPKYPSYKVSQTPLNNDNNFAYLSGSSIYAFNGLSFYKVSTDNRQVEVLSSGQKLPKPYRIYWANDNGALMSFKESFIRTQVASQLSSRGVDDTSFADTYLWYLSFKDNSLRIVEDSLPQTDTVHYSEADQGFYYLKAFGGGSVEGHPALQVNFYSIKDFELSIVNEDIEMVDTSYTGVCPKSQSGVCVVGRDRDELTSNKLVEVTKGGELNTLLASEGRLIATSSASKYLTTTPDVSSQGEDPEDITPTQTSINDLATGTSFALDFKVGSESVVTSFIDENTFYAIRSNTETGEGGASYLSATNNILGQISTKEKYFSSDNNSFSGGVVGTVSYGKSGVTLLTSTDGSQFLVSKEEDSGINLDRIPVNEVQTIVNSCVKSSAVNSQFFEENHLFRIYFNDNDQFSKNIKAFSSCMATKPEMMFGYQYDLFGVSPINGRITTD